MPAKPTRPNWTTEFPEIVTVGRSYNVDPLFLAAIRAAENGLPGREFGLLPSSRYPDYIAQLNGAAATVRHNLINYTANPLSTGIIRDALGPHRRLRYSRVWITYLAHIWAPIGAHNDPHGLNPNWSRFIQTGRPT